jgi:hypothetical protein
MDNNKPVKLSPEELQQKINLETGKISWPELQRHFARGAVINVDPGIDLVQVASAFAYDQRNQVAQWMTDGKVVRATDEHARQWTDENPVFWAVVVAPWVLVQEATP